MLQGWAMARLYVENLGLTKNKEIRNPLQNKTKQNKTSNQNKKQTIHFPNREGVLSPLYLQRPF